MDSQWPPYQDASGSSSRRYNGNGQMPRDYGSQIQSPSHPQSQSQSQAQQPPAGFKFDPYAANSPQNPTASPAMSPQLRDGNGDVAMHDAHDPYGSRQYPMRPHHQSHLSGGRPANLHSAQEPSAAAQRYSPMEALSPTSPYAPKSASLNQYASPSNQRQSPTRQGDYPHPQSPYYTAPRQTQQLPPISTYAAAHDNYPSSAVSNLDASFANDPKSPRRAIPPSLAFAGKGPVPECRKLRGPTDLRPKVNTQPAFRRANPEGGFISVSCCPRHTKMLLY